MFNRAEPKEIDMTDIASKITLLKWPTKFASLALQTFNQAHALSSTELNTICSKLSTWLARNPDATASIFCSHLACEFEQVIEAPCAQYLPPIAGAKSLKQFSASGVRTPEGIYYAAGGVIDITPEGDYFLTIGRSYWASKDLHELEQRLYSGWYLSECIPDTSVQQVGDRLLGFRVGDKATIIGSNDVATIFAIEDVGGRPSVSLLFTKPQTGAFVFHEPGSHIASTWTE